MDDSKASELPPNAAVMIDAPSGPLPAAVFSQDSGSEDEIIAIAKGTQQITG